MASYPALATASSGTASSTSGVTSLSSGNIEYWLRMNLIEDQCLRQAVNDVMHNRQGDSAFQGLPEDGYQLCNEMNQFRQSAEGVRLENKRVIKLHQWNKLCPSSGTSDSKDWDISLMRFPIQYITGLAPPIGGWKIQTPDKSDGSKAANVYRASELRNEIKHNPSAMYSKQKFNDALARAEKVLIGLDYQNMGLFEQLKTVSLEMYTEKLVTIMKTYLETEIKDVNCAIDKIEANAILNDKNLQDLQKKFANFHQLFNHLQNMINNNLGHLKHQAQTQADLSDELNRLDGSISELNGHLKGIEERLSKVEEMANQNSLGLLEEKDRDKSEQIRVNSEQIHVNSKQIHDHSEQIRDNSEQIETLKQQSKASDQTLLIALKIVADETGDDWETLAIRLGITVDDSLMNSFKNAKYEVSWGELKNALQFIGRDDIVKKIENETNITVEINSSFQSARRLVSEKISKGQVLQPFLKAHSNTRYERKQHEDIYVDLAVLSGNFPCIQNNESEYFINQSVLSRKLVSLKEIITVGGNNCSVITGVAGIGKTKLMEHIIYEWGQKKLFNGEDNTPSIQLLIPIFCRELFALKLSRDDCLDSFLKKLHPDIFECLSYSQLPNVLKNKVMFVVDGLDEVITPADLISKDNGINSTIIDFIKQILLSTDGSYAIVAGRPVVTREITSLIAEKRKCMEFQVDGFNEQNIERYIDKHCEEEQLKKKVRQEIFHNANLKIMARIPVYLQCICNVFRSDLTVKAPRTVTELMIYSSLVFIRDHLQLHNGKLKKMTLSEMWKNTDVLDVVETMGMLCFESLKKKKLLFTREELERVIDDVDNFEEKSGLIMKVMSESCTLYQFSHLTIQEFFASIYLFLSNELKPMLVSTGIRYFKDDEVIARGNCELCGMTRYFFKHGENFPGCYRMIAGLEGLANSPIFASFIENIKKSKGRISETPFMDCLQRDIFGNVLEKWDSMSLYFEFGKPLPSKLCAIYMEKGIYCLTWQNVKVLHYHVKNNFRGFILETIPSCESSSEKQVKYLADVINASDQFCIDKNFPNELYERIRLNSGSLLTSIRITGDVKIDYSDSLLRLLSRVEKVYFAFDSAIHFINQVQKQQKDFHIHHVVTGLVPTFEFLVTFRKTERMTICGDHLWEKFMDYHNHVVCLGEDFVNLLEEMCSQNQLALQHLFVYYHNEKPFNHNVSQFVMRLLCKLQNVTIIICRKDIDIEEELIRCLCDMKTEDVRGTLEVQSEHASLLKEKLSNCLNSKITILQIEKPDFKLVPTIETCDGQYYNVISTDDSQSYCVNLNQSDHQCAGNLKDNCVV